MALITDAQRVKNTELLTKCLSEAHEDSCKVLQAAAETVPACQARVQKMSPAEQAEVFAQVMGCMAVMPPCTAARKTNPGAACPEVKKACGPMKGKLLKLCPEAFAPEKAKTNNTTIILAVAAVAVVGFFLWKR